MRHQPVMADWNRFNQDYDFEERSDVKGKGRVTTYLLVGRKTSTVTGSESPRPR